MTMYSTTIYFEIALVLLIWFVTLSKAEPMHVFPVDFNDESSMSCYSVFLKISISECVKECLSRPNRCTHVRHNRLYRICSICDDTVALFNRDLPGDTVIDVSRNKNKLTSLVSDLCAPVNCNRTEKCERDAGTCKPSECEFPESLNGTYYPSGPITSVNAKIKFDCLDNVLPECPIFKTCENNSSWSDEEITSVLVGNGNIALHKTAIQSSAWGGDELYHGLGITDFTAGKAVDGVNSHALTAGTCTHTAGDQKPWWRVDLANYFWVHRIIIYNRNEFYDRLHDISVTVGSTTDNMIHCGFYKGPGTLSDLIVTVTCVLPIYGKFVQLQIIEDTADPYLTLCEVEVFSD